MTEGRQKENTSPLQAGIAPEANFITLRSIAIGAVLSFFLNFLDVYATTMIRGAYLTLNFSTPAALFFFFFVILANGLVALIRKPLALTQAEQITIYIMLIIACCIPGMGFTQFMIPCLVGSTYYATPENGWDEFYNQHIDAWMIPQGENVVRFFFEGLPQGASTPWVPWIYPLACWYGFFLALCAAMIFSMVILRKQWMDRERLVYPLAQVPMEMIQQERDGIVGKPFFANRIMWTGFAVSFILLSVNGLHTYFPFFPDIERHTRLLLFRNEGRHGVLVQPSLDRVFLLRQSRHLRLHLGLLYPHHNSTRHLQHDRSAEYASVGRIRARPFFRPPGNGGHDCLRGGSGSGLPAGICAK